MASRRTCFVHIGTHKTGTTSIQSMLATNDAAFATFGIYIPHAGRAHPEFAGHHHLAWNLLGDGRYQARLGGIDHLRMELKPRAERSICISAEDLGFLHAKPDAMRTLAAALRASGYEPRIVTYLRPQAAYATSLYHELCNIDSGLDFAAFVETILRDGSFGAAPYIALLEYDVLLDTFAAVFGAANIIVRPFIGGADKDALLRDFVQTIAPENPQIIPALRFGERHNISAPRGAFTPLDPPMLERFAERFAASNQRLRERYGTEIRPTPAG